METTSTELLDADHKHDARGRRIADEARRAEVLAGYEGCGLTQKAYARREGINYHTFVAWLGQLRRTGAPGSQRSPAVKAHFAEVQLSALRVGGGCLEVALPDGVVVRGNDAAGMAALIRELRS